MSHELRTPLATLKLLSETLSLDGGGDPEVTHDYLGRIEVEVDRLAQMVDELGELSLIETGQVALERTAVPVSVLAHRAVERLDAQAARAGATVIVDIPDGLPDVYGDERRWIGSSLSPAHASSSTPPREQSACQEEDEVSCGVGARTGQHRAG
jgi:two-component system phosphate regulon sensor histidine kinase PhoR